VLIYDVREIADGRINEMVPLRPDIAKHFLRVVCDGARESGKLITTFARGTRRNSFITTFEREIHARFGRIS